jgi:hypothetical protein
MGPYQYLVGAYERGFRPMSLTVEGKIDDINILVNILIRSEKRAATTEKSGIYKGLQASRQLQVAIESCVDNRRTSPPKHNKADGRHAVGRDCTDNRRRPPLRT